MKTEIAQHTPTPWFTSSDNRGIIVGGKRLGMMNKAEDSSYVVRAVNCHGDLLDFVKRSLHSWSPSLADEAEKLIAKAESL
jgi:hypothetical protein